MADDPVDDSSEERALADVDRQIADLESKLDMYTKNIPPGREDFYALSARVTSASLRRAKEYRTALATDRVDAGDEPRLETVEEALQALKRRVTKDAEDSDDAAPEIPTTWQPGGWRPELLKLDGEVVSRRRVVLGAIAIGLALAVIGAAFALTRSDGEPPPRTLGSFGGHYVLVEGFDDPTGADVYPTAPRMYPITTPGAATGTFDIDETGRITAGAVQISKSGSGNGRGCSFAFDAATASGSVALFRKGVRGQVSWTGTQSFGGDCASTPSYETSSSFQIGIAGDTAVLCRSDLEAHLDACAEIQTRIVAKFRKES